MEGAMSSPFAWWFTHSTRGFVTSQVPELIKMHLAPGLGTLAGPLLPSKHLQGQLQGEMCASGKREGPRQVLEHGNLLAEPKHWRWCWIPAPSLLWFGRSESLGLFFITSLSSLVFKFQEFILALIWRDLHWSFLLTTANGNFIPKSSLYWNTTLFSKKTWICKH